MTVFLVGFLSFVTAATGPSIFPRLSPQTPTVNISLLLGVSLETLIEVLGPADRHDSYVMVVREEAWPKLAELMALPLEKLRAKPWSLETNLYWWDKIKPILRSDRIDGVSMANAKFADGKMESLGFALGYYPGMGPDAAKIAYPDHGLPISEYREHVSEFSLRDKQGQPWKVEVQEGRETLGGGNFRTLFLVSSTKAAKPSASENMGLNIEVSTNKEGKVSTVSLTSTPPLSARKMWAKLGIGMADLPEKATPIRDSDFLQYHPATERWREFEFMGKNGVVIVRKPPKK